MERSNAGKSVFSGLFRGWARTGTPLAMFRCGARTEGAIGGTMMVAQGLTNERIGWLGAVLFLWLVLVVGGIMQLSL